MAEAKRHHYVPRVLLRRFSRDPKADNPPLWRLDKKGGRPSLRPCLPRLCVGPAGFQASPDRFTIPYLKLNGEKSARANFPERQSINVFPPPSMPR